MSKESSLYLVSSSPILIQKSSPVWEPSGIQYFPIQLEDDTIRAVLAKSKQNTQKAVFKDHKKLSCLISNSAFQF